MLDQDGVAAALALLRVRPVDGPTIRALPLRAAPTQERTNPGEYVHRSTCRLPIE